MKKIVYEKPGSPEVMKIVEVDDLNPEISEVVIDVHRAGINFADLLMRMGLYRPLPEFPFTPGYEVSGIIAKIGDNVENFNVGDRVMALSEIGGYAEQICVDSNQVFKLNDKISFDEAAAMPVTYVTAYHMLVHLGNMKQGDTVLIHSAAGGVGTAAAQIAKAMGAGKIFGTASRSKSEFLESTGVIPIDKESDFLTYVRQNTERKGVMHVLDPIGGDTLKKSYRALCSGGRLYSFGFSSAAPKKKFSRITALSHLIKSPKFKPIQMIGANKAVFGVHMGTLNDNKLMREHSTQLLKMLINKEINPILDSVFRFEDCINAHEHIHQRKNIGKVLLDFS